MRRTAPTILAAALAATVIASGCGGGNDFKSQYQGLSTNLGELGRGLGPALTSGGNESDAELASKLTPMSSQLDDLAGQISDLHAPGNLSADLSALQRATNSAATELHELITAVKTNDSTAASAATTALITDASAVTAARNKLDGEVGD